MPKPEAEIGKVLQNLNYLEMISLFNYQQGALNRIFKAFKTRFFVLVVMATGLGKTIVSAFWAKTELKKKQRGLFLCHENDILNQALEMFRLVLGPLPIFRTFYGNGKDWNADNADIVFASFQSFSEWHQAFDKDHFDFIIVDESHHSQASTFKEVIQYFTPKKLFGMTATPDRMDGREIREIFGKETVNISLEEAIAKNWLTPIEYHILSDGINTGRLKKIVKDVLEEGKRITVKQLNENIFIKGRDEEQAQIIQSYTKNKKCMIFCENIEHVNNFSKYLPNAKSFHSKISQKTNEETLYEFKTGKIQYILSVNKFNEGIDIPDAEVIVFLRTTDSKTIFFQQLGRGLRKITNKEKVIVLDFVANCERITILQDLVNKIKEIAGLKLPFDKNLINVNGNGFDFTFSDNLINILNVLSKIREGFYKTWQEASKVCIENKVKKQRDYYKCYRQIDPKLYSAPDVFYNDFPGWKIFLGKGKGKTYQTWQEASKICIENGVKNYREYLKDYKQIDSRLSSCPDTFYEDFPGWGIFLGKNERSKLARSKLYLTWQEASKICINYKVVSEKDYFRRYKKIDSKLPGNPYTFYKKDFPGWPIFLGRKKKDFYKTWQEASRVCIDNRVVYQKDYNKRYKQIDSKLPSRPEDKYENFPGWSIFLGRKSSL